MKYQGKFGHRVSTHELSDVHDPAGPGSGTATRPLAGHVAGSDDAHPNGKH